MIIVVMMNDDDEDEIDADVAGVVDEEDAYDNFLAQWLLAGFNLAAGLCVHISANTDGLPIFIQVVNKMVGTKDAAHATEQQRQNDERAVYNLVKYKQI